MGYKVKKARPNPLFYERAC